MGRAVALREDFDGPALRRLAKASKDAGQSRRLLALAEIYDGGRRTEAARIGTVGLQVVRDWVLRFNAKGPDGLIDGKATGKAAKLNDRQLDKRSLGLLRADRFRRSTVSCVGAERTWRIGYSKSSAFRLMRRRWAVN